jgi:hypothetical protein
MPGRRRFVASRRGRGGRVPRIRRIERHPTQEILMRPIVLAAALGLAVLCAQAAEQARSVAPFTSIANSGPIGVSIEVGKPLSVTASGSEVFLDNLVTEVSGGELQIRLKEHHPSNFKGDSHVTITMPQFTHYRMSGAGDTTLTHMAGDSLEVEMSGAGSLHGEGSVKTLKLQLSGVGSVDMRELHAENVDARVGGVGSVKVWASSRLDAAVGGIGSLTYYGDPKTVNTSGGGIGSISRGK